MQMGKNRKTVDDEILSVITNELTENDLEEKNTLFGLMLLLSLTIIHIE